MHINTEVIVVGTGERGRIEAIDKGIFIVRLDGAGLRQFKRRELRVMTLLEVSRNRSLRVAVWIVSVVPQQALTVVIRAAVISLVVMFIPELGPFNT